MNSNFTKGILTGICISFTIATIAMGSYVFYLYQTARPGFTVSQETREFTDSEVSKITGALVELSQISDLFGLNKTAALTTGSAAVIIGQKSPLLAKYHFARAIQITEEIASGSNDYNPLLETRFHYALFLKDIGAKQEAKDYLAESLQIGLRYAPGSHWIDNIKRVQRYLEKNS